MLTLMETHLRRAWDISRLMSRAEALAANVAHRIANGYGCAPTYLLGSSPKTDKNRMRTWIQYLAPYMNGGANACPWATPGCAGACLYTSGHGQRKTVQRGSIARNKFAMDNPMAYLSLLWWEVGAINRRAYDTAARLNGTSDIRWERVIPELFDTFRDVVFYDYTKAPATRWANLPSNYSLTMSAHENMTMGEIVAHLDEGRNVAVVVDTPAPKGGQPYAPLPETWAGYPVIDGDMSDFRPDDPAGSVVLLRAKGDAVGDTSGFVFPTRVGRVLSVAR